MDIDVHDTASAILFLLNDRVDTITSQVQKLASTLEYILPIEHHEVLDANTKNFLICTISTTVSSVGETATVIRLLMDSNLAKAAEGGYRAHMDAIRHRLGDCHRTIVDISQWVYKHRGWIQGDFQTSSV